MVHFSRGGSPQVKCLKKPHFDYLGFQTGIGMGNGKWE
jgi:hypothetical protein